MKEFAEAAMSIAWRVFAGTAAIVPFGVAWFAAVPALGKSRRGRRRERSEGAETERPKHRETVELKDFEQSVHRLEKLIGRCFSPDELAGHRYRSCVRKAWRQGEAFGDRISVLALASGTERETARAKEELAALQAQMENTAHAIATSGLGARTKATRLHGNHFRAAVETGVRTRPRRVEPITPTAADVALRTRRRPSSSRRLAAGCATRFRMPSECAPAQSCALAA